MDKATSASRNPVFSFILSQTILRDQRAEKHSRRASQLYTSTNPRMFSPPAAPLNHGGFGGAVVMSHLSHALPCRAKVSLPSDKRRHVLG